MLRIRKLKDAKRPASDVGGTWRFLSFREGLRSVIGIGHFLAKLLVLACRRAIIVDAGAQPELNRRYTQSDYFQVFFLGY
jgi:hypothetical protein